MNLLVTWSVIRRRIFITAFFTGLSVVAGPAVSEAAWTKQYGFDKNGSSFDVVVTLSGDSLNDLFSHGYDGTSLSGFSSILTALDVGSQASTAALHDHLVRAMLGLSGYDPFSNPGQVDMVYDSTGAYRYLRADYNGGVAVDEVIDWAAPVIGTKAYVIHRGTMIPEPTTAVLLGLALGGMSMRRRHPG